MDPTKQRGQFRTAISSPSEVPEGATNSSLVVMAGPAMGTKVILDKDPVVIGRLPECELCIEHDSVSRNHAKVELAAGKWRVVDMGSTNGTIVNSEKVAEHYLKDGDLVKIGKAVIKFMADGSLEAGYLEQLHQLTAVDALTGAVNRRRFEEMLKSEMAKRSFDSSALSLILFDVDHFKKINDGHGHPAGDAVLQTLAKTVKSAMPGSLQLARVGGEEFAVLCPGVGAEMARNLAEMIRARVEATRIEFAEKHIPVTISLGVAERNAETNTTELLYMAADARLYAAKSSGRNKVS